MGFPRGSQGLRCQSPTLGPGPGPVSLCMTWAWPLGTNECTWISVCTFVLCGGCLLVNEMFHITTDFFFFKGEKRSNSGQIFS